MSDHKCARALLDVAEFRYQATAGDAPLDRQTALRQAEALWRRVGQELERVAPQQE